jgi:HK97 family phage portal protein
MGLFTKAVQTLARNLGLRDDRLYTFLSEPSESGERVSIEGSLQLDTVWACVRLKAQTIATLPLDLFRIDGESSAKATEHDLYPILHDQPNQDMTAVEFWEAMGACEQLWGNAYAQKAYASNGKLIALYPMRPDRIEVRREPDGSITYAYDFDGRRELMTEDEVFHIRGFSLDGMLGISPIAQARNNLGTARAAEKAAGALFRNGMRPSGILKAPTYLTGPQRDDAKAMVQAYSGALSTGKVPLLEGGWDYQALTMPPEDAQLLETRSFAIEQICRWFGVPPVMVGHMEKSTAWGTGLEQMGLWFLTFSLRSDLKRIEQSIARQLLRPQERKKYFAKFNVEGLLRADSSARASYYSTMVQNGIMTRNEVRKLENMPSVDGGDDLTVQSNLAPLERLGEDPGQPQAPPLLPVAPEIRQ